MAVVAPNLLTKPATVMFNKVTIKGAKQAVQMFGPAQRAVAMAVADSVEDGTIPAAEADNLFICVGVFIHWLAEDDKKIQDYNYQAAQRVDPACREGLADRSRSGGQEGHGRAPVPGRVVRRVQGAHAGKPARAGSGLLVLPTGSSGRLSCVCVRQRA